MPWTSCHKAAVCSYVLHPSKATLSFSPNTDMPKTALKHVAHPEPHPSSRYPLPAPVRGGLAARRLRPVPSLMDADRLVIPIPNDSRTLDAGLSAGGKSLGPQRRSAFANPFSNFDMIV